jgi:hypothetical protein
LLDFREVRDKYINVKNPPASTAIQVPRLFRPELLVEVEAVAVVQSNYRLAVGQNTPALELLRVTISQGVRMLERPFGEQP